MNKVQTTIDPPPAWMPEHQFEAQFCGSDYDNFIYIRPADSASLVSLFCIYFPLYL